MSQPRLPWFVVVPLVLSGPSGLLAAERPSKPEDVGYVVRAVNQTMSAPCEAELRADRAVIVGGLSASALKPTEARAALDRLVQAVGDFAESRGGALTLLERTRAVRAAPRDPARPQAEAPFVTVQRLEVEIPAEADADSLLEGLLKLGLDQYGRELVLDPSAEAFRSSRPAQAVVRYRVSRLRERVRQIHDRCRQEAIDVWCGSSVPFPEREACGSALGRLADRFTTQSFTLQSQPLPRPEGGVAPFTLSSTVGWNPHGPARLDSSGAFTEGRGEVELVGLVPLAMRGSITVVLVGGR